MIHSLKKLLLSSVLCLGTSFVYAQTQPKPTLGWQRCIGGGQVETAASIVSTFDSAYVVLGITESTGGDVDSNKGFYDYFLTKISASGSLLWTRTLGGSSFDMAAQITQTRDSGFIVVGYAASSDGNLTSNKGMYDAWMMKLDKSGYIQWQKSYGGSKHDAALSARQTFDGGYIVAGWSASDDGDLPLNKGGEDCWLLKLDSAGNIEWQQTLGGSLEDHFTAVLQTLDSGYLAVGSVESADGDVVGHKGSMDIWVVKFAQTGSVMWKKIYGGTGIEHCGEHGFVGSTLQAYGGGYVIGAFSNSKDGDVTGNHGDYDAWILKISDTGALLWQRSVGGSGDDESMYLVQMPDSSIISAGLAQFADGDIDTVFGGYDAWVFKLDKHGNLVWEQVFGGPNKEVAFAMALTPDTSVIIAGYSSGNGGQVSGFRGGLHDIWVAKLNMTPLPPVVNGIAGTSPASLSVAPNPTSGILTVSGVNSSVQLKLFSVVGQEIRSARSNRINLEGLPAAVYVLKVYDASGLLLGQQKVVKQ